MRGARPWWTGHRQPRQPLLGCLDESLPSTWEVYNRLAADHGVDALIWDWYWYHDEPAMHEALEQGFLAADNRMDLSFALMWVNHHWLTLFPTTLGDGSARFPRAFAAPDSAQDMWRGLSYMVARYLHQPNYWRIEGEPVLVIWDVRRMERLIGSTSVTRLFSELEMLARAMGHPGLHLHTPLGGESGGRPTPPSAGHQPLEALGFKSFGSYTLVPSVADERPADDEVPLYDTVADEIVTRVCPSCRARAGCPTGRPWRQDGTPRRGSLSQHDPARPTAASGRDSRCARARRPGPSRPSSAVPSRIWTNTPSTRESSPSGASTNGPRASTCCRTPTSATACCRRWPEHAAWATIARTSPPRGRVPSGQPPRHSRLTPRESAGRPPAARRGGRLFGRRRHHPAPGPASGPPAPDRPADVLSPRPRR